MGGGSSDGTGGGAKAGKADRAAAREARLKHALRANLRRRKAPEARAEGPESDLPAPASGDGATDNQDPAAKDS